MRPTILTTIFRNWINCRATSGSSNCGKASGAASIMDSKDSYDCGNRLSSKDSKSSSDMIDGRRQSSSHRQHIHAASADAKDSGDSSIIITKKDLMSKDSFDDDLISALMSRNGININSSSSSSSGAAAVAPIPEPELSSHEVAQHIVKGLRINYMSMRDEAKPKEILWRSSSLWGDDMFDREYRESIPRSILQCKAVVREVNFSSMEPLDNFRIQQRILFRGVCIEEWLFRFGFVIPGSTNSWEHTIYAAPADKIMPAEILTGNVVIETSFFDADFFLCKNVVRIFYE